MQKNYVKNNTAIYQGKNGSIHLKEDNQKNTVWASKKDIAHIFDIDRSVVSRHINNIFKDAELNQKVVCANFAQTTEHGALKGKTQTKEVEHYNLDIILAIGYRTNSSRAIQFRIWATKVLKQHITKGYTINPQQVKKNHETRRELLIGLKKSLMMIVKLVS